MHLHAQARERPYALRVLAVPAVADALPVQALVVAVCLAGLVILVLWVTIVAPGRVAAAWDQEAAQWQQTGLYPPQVERRYRGSQSNARADVLRMQSLGYRIGDLRWNRAGIRVTWVRGAA